MLNRIVNVKYNTCNHFTAFKQKINIELIYKCE